VESPLAVAHPPDVDPVVLARVRTCFAEALGLDIADVDYSSRVIADLGAESLDFLDIAFRLERAFDIRIPRGGVEAASREDLAAGESYEVNGLLTPSALAKLAAHMPEVPPEEFRDGLKVSEIPMLFRVGTFYNVVIALREDKVQ
jgi:acyl carrier protein